MGEKISEEFDERKLDPDDFAHFDPDFIVTSEMIKKIIDDSRELRKRIADWKNEHGFSPLAIHLKNRFENLEL